MLFSGHTCTRCVQSQFEGVVFPPSLFPILGEMSELCFYRIMYKENRYCYLPLICIHHPFYLCNAKVDT